PTRRSSDLRLFRQQLLRLQIYRTCLLVYARFFTCKRHHPRAVAAVATMSSTQPRVPMYVPIHLPKSGHRVDVQLFGIRNRVAANHAGHEWNTLRERNTEKIMGNSHME